MKSIWKFIKRIPSTKTGRMAIAVILAWVSRKTGVVPDNHTFAELANGTTATVATLAVLLRDGRAKTEQAAREATVTMRRKRR